MKKQALVTADTYQLDLFSLADAPQVNFFAGIDNLQELKKEYRRLAMENHPDKGGDSQTMAAINRQFDELSHELAQNKEARTEGKKECPIREEGMTAEEAAEEAARQFKEALAKLMKFNVTIELRGCWLWIFGDTKPIKEDLKEIGCRWAPRYDGMPWVWHDSVYRYISGRGRKTNEDIIAKYGCQVLKEGETA